MKWETMARERRNVLLVYALYDHPVRDTIRDHLFAFRRYSRHRYFYMNAALRRPSRLLERVSFDAIVFHTTFLAPRWTPTVFEELVERVRPLERMDARRAIVPQDEYLRSDMVCDFIDEFDVSHVFTTAPASEWPKIYRSVDRTRVGFTTVLTGYLEPRSVKRMEDIAHETPQRHLDISYRAWRAAPWLGRHGTLKMRIAESFDEHGAARGLRMDISTRAQDTLYGDDWYRLLASSKYTIGVEGGASVLDRDGSIKDATERYLAEHPDAGFEEIEAHCFPGEDGRLALFALSPRHLEACATRTCQILVSGSYNGILKPGRHYIELDRDLGNLEQVLDTVQRDEQRERIVEAAWREVVASGRHSYASFVEEIERVTLRDAGVAVAGASGLGRARARGSAPIGRSGLAHALVCAMDRLSWVELALRASAAARALSPLVRFARTLVARARPARLSERPARGR